MIIDILLYNLIAWYIENVFPGQYGLPQPWYFMFQPSFWRGRRVARVSSGDGGGVELDTIDADKNESAPSDLEAGIVLDKLRKTFNTRDGEKVAVNDFSLKMYKGQITALLGHNGAGKTTTMSMLVGLFPSTSGTAYVNGLDVAAG